MADAGVLQKTAAPGPVEADVEARIAAGATRFELVALVDLLLEMGYGIDDLFFESYPATVSQESLVHGVEFRTEPSRQVVVTLNMGLLGAQSPLPSYFQKVMDSGSIDEEAFITFVRFFEHSVLRSFVLGLYPERSPAFFKDWEETQRCYLKLIGPASIGTLHWLFQIIFPELGVEVERAALRRDLAADPLRLGGAVLGGGGTLGGRASVPVAGFAVRLTSDEETTSRSRPWAEEVHRRLRAVIFPVLEDGDLDLDIVLVIRGQRAFARLQSGGYLGFDRIRGGEERHRVVKIFRGGVPRTSARA